MADVSDDKKKDSEVEFFFAIIEQLDGSVTTTPAGGSPIH